MTNQPIYLRFHGEQLGEVPTISPRSVADICEAIGRTYTAAGEVLAPSAQFSVEFYFLKGPERGSLLIKLAAAFVAAGDLTFGMLTSVSEELSAGADAATLGKILWDLVFRREGTLDQVRKPDGDVPTTSERMARREPVNRPEFRSVALQVFDAAAASGASRVELEIEEGHIVVLFDRGARTDPTLLARSSYGGSATKTGHVKGSIQRMSNEVLKGTLNEQPVKVFLGQRQGTDDATGAQVVVWRSRHSIPEIGQTMDFAGQIMSFLDRASLKIADGIPYSFETSSEPILIVEKASDWG